MTALAPLPPNSRNHARSCPVASMRIVLERGDIPICNCGAWSHNRHAAEIAYAVHADRAARVVAGVQT